jgi:ParB-like chromosome segregation protein Spo0J
MFLKIEDVVVDSRFQSRIALNDEAIEEYAARYEEGLKLPPLSVVKVDDRYILVDGFHRYAALKKLGDYEVEVTILKGETEEDAKYMSWAANKTHGLHRTNADKRKTVLEMLNHPEYGKQADRQIALHIGVSHTYVSLMRNRQAEPPKASTFTPPPVKPEPVEEKEEINDQEVMIQTLMEENARLNNVLAMESLPADEKDAGKALIEELQAEVKLLTVELDSVKKSRDTYQAENAQLKKQVAAQQRKIKSLESK